MGIIITISFLWGYQKWELSAAFAAAATCSLCNKLPQFDA